MDEAAAKANPFFDGRVAHGYFVVSLAAGLFVDPDPGPVLANYGVDNLRFLTPVYPGDTLRVALTCKQKTARETENYGEVRWDCTVTNQDGKRLRPVRRADPGRRRRRTEHGPDLRHRRPRSPSSTPPPSSTRPRS